MSQLNGDTIEEIAAYLHGIKTTVLTGVAVSLEADLARHAAREQAGMQADAEGYQRADRNRSAQTLNSTMALAGVEAGARARDEDWVVLVPAGRSEAPELPPASKAPVVVALAPAEPPATPGKPGRPRRPLA